jgi:hypothetical protein
MAASGLDGFGLYLFGIVLQALDNKADARDALIASVSLYPCNWSAWRALEALCTDRAKVRPNFRCVFVCSSQRVCSVSLKRLRWL